MVKNRYDAAGEKVVLKHKEDPSDTEFGNHCAWFDDGNTSVNLKAAYDNQDAFPQWLQNRMSEELIDSSLEEVEALLAFLADNKLLVCGCGRPFPKSNAVSTGFAGVQCEMCASENAYCPETEDHSHIMKVTSGRHNARVPKRSVCTECGYKTQSPPTG